MEDKESTIEKDNDQQLFNEFQKVNSKVQKVLKVLEIDQMLFNFILFIGEK